MTAERFKNKKDLIVFCYFAWCISQSEWKCQHKFCRFEKFWNRKNMLWTLFNYWTAKMRKYANKVASIYEIERKWDLSIVCFYVADIHFFIVVLSIVLGSSSIDFGIPNFKYYVIFDIIFDVMFFMFTFYWKKKF